MKRDWKIFVLRCLTAGMSLTACDSKPLRLNQELKLPAAQVEAYKKRADNGDAAAAKKLWLHYSYGEQNRTEGAHWKSVYDDIVRNDPSKHVDD
jgi:hypothetical protein